MPTRTRAPSDQGITVAQILSQKITKGRNQEWSNTGLPTQLREKTEKEVDDPGRGGSNAGDVGVGREG